MIEGEPLLRFKGQLQLELGHKLELLLGQYSLAALVELELLVQLELPELLELLGLLLRLIDLEADLK